MTARARADSVDSIAGSASDSESPFERVISLGAYETNGRWKVWFKRRAKKTDTTAKKDTIPGSADTEEEVLATWATFRCTLNRPHSQGGRRASSADGRPRSRPPSLDGRPPLPPVVVIASRALAPDPAPAPAPVPALDELAAVPVVPSSCGFVPELAPPEVRCSLFGSVSVVKYVWVDLRLSGGGGARAARAARAPPPCSSRE